MIGPHIGLGIAGGESAQNKLRRYFVEGVRPGLVLDFERGVYGKDDLASFDKYTVGDNEPSLVFDFTEAQYGRQ